MTAASSSWRDGAWAHGRWAYPALFVGSVIESTVLPWPIEFPLLAIMLRGRGHVFPAAAVVTVGSVIGCVIAFSFGAFAYGLVEPWLAEHPDWAAAVEVARGKAEARGALAAFIGMMTPAPVQITSFACGLAGVGLPAFVLASLAGRTVRYFAMAVLVYLFGEAIMDWWRGRRTLVRRLIVAGLVVLFLIALVATLTM
ncbi:MAG: VTT domain-containing protein [Maricaulaceae bacterium]